MKVTRPYYSKLYTPVRQVETSASADSESDGESFVGGRFGGFEALRRKVAFYEDNNRKDDENYANGSKLSAETLIELNSARSDRIFNLSKYKKVRVDVVHDNPSKRGKAENIEV